MKRLSLLALLLIMIAVLDSFRPAYAYLDAGTASMLLQIILGGVAGALVVLKIYWHRVKSWFVFKSSKQSERAAHARKEIKGEN